MFALKHRGTLESQHEHFLKVILSELINLLELQFLRKKNKIKKNLSNPT